MDICTFVKSIVVEESRSNILICSRLDDLNTTQKYDVVVLDEMIEYIPVFQMELVWAKAKQLLHYGGLIVLRTPVYKNPNQLDTDEESYQNLRCNKQTLGTIMRSCLKENLLLVKSLDNCFAFMKKNELKNYDLDQQKHIVSSHNEWIEQFGMEVKDVYDKSELRKLIPGAGRIAIGCVAENNQKFQTQALRLVQSIRWFGGNTAGVNIFVCMVDEADPMFVKELEKWGVFVRIIKRFSVAHPPSNKLRLFELDEIYNYDTIMLLDCDTVIVQDPYPFIDGEHFQADIAAATTVPYHQFKKLFKYYCLPLPEQTYITSISLASILCFLLNENSFETAAF